MSEIWMRKKRIISNLDHPMTIGQTPEIWWDGSDSSTVTLSGSNVTGWLDKSGNGHNLTQGTSANQPTYTETINSKNVITFDGINDFLSISAAGIDWSGNDFTVFSVAKLNSSVTGYRGIITNRPGSSNWFTVGNYDSDETIRLETGASPISTVSTGFSASGQPAFITTIRKSGTTGEIGIDFGSLTSGTITSSIGTTTNNIYVGQWLSSGQNWDGDIAEIIIYLAKLSDYQVYKVRRYLSNKWGI